LDENINDVDWLATFLAETAVRHINEVAPEGGVIIGSQQMNINVLDLPSYPPNSEMK
jgi:hypothetical protein